MGELLRPKPTNASQFDATRARLAGMHESAATLRRPADGADARAAAQILAPTLLQYMHAALVPPPADADAERADRSMTAVRLSAATLADDGPVLAVVEVLADGGLRLAVHAEDAIAGNILLDELRAALSA